MHEGISHGRANAHHKRPWDVHVWFVGIYGVISRRVQGILSLDEHGQAESCGRFAQFCNPQSRGSQAGQASEAFRASGMIGFQRWENQHDGGAGADKANLWLTKPPFLQVLLVSSSRAGGLLEARWMPYWWRSGVAPACF